jgi:hypothetical protein
MASIRPQPYDIAMDFIITESGVQQRCNGQLVRLDDAQAIGRAMATLRAHKAAPPPDSASPPCYAADFETPR